MRRSNCRKVYRVPVAAHLNGIAVLDVLHESKAGQGFAMSTGRSALTPGRL